MITVDNLSKTFRVARRASGMGAAVRSFFHPRFETVRALDGISFHIAPGEIVGYIGPNGAGKSTTVKILSGILTPDSGTCEIGGIVPWRHRRRHVARIGVVFGQRTQLWWDTPVIDSFDLLRDIYRVPQDRYVKTRDRLVESLGLGPLLTTPVRQLSLGQRMKCELAASMLHEPSILFLDEPTIGLDATARLAIRDFIRTENQERGVTVLLTTHDTHDIEALCSRVMLIGKGRILYDGGFAELKKRYDGDGATEADVIIDRLYKDYEL
ncbi:MAG: ABC transporter ATP-binding protein [Clostridia bacterium]|nr:ABC transporter ATP-binding protein [Clostridia bacterium]